MDLRKFGAYARARICRAGRGGARGPMRPSLGLVVFLHLWAPGAWARRKRRSRGAESITFGIRDIEPLDDPALEEQRRELDRQSEEREMWFTAATSSQFGVVRARAPRGRERRVLPPRPIARARASETPKGGRRAPRSALRHARLSHPRHPPPPRPRARRRCSRPTRSGAAARVPTPSSPSSARSPRSPAPSRRACRSSAFSTAGASRRTTRSRRCAPPPPRPRPAMSPRPFHRPPSFPRGDPYGGRSGRRARRDGIV